MKPWYVYILRCFDGTLYTGITNDLDKRLKAHGDGSGARYTRSRRPVELVYSEPAGSRSAATLREAEVKKLPRRQKIAMIAANRSDEEQRLKDIADAWMELWQGGDLCNFDRLHSPGFVDHSPSGRGSDRAAFRQGIEDLYRAFPDFKAHTEDVVVHVQTDGVVLRWTRNPHGMVVVVLLRHIAYNHVSLFRNVYLRAAKNRELPGGSCSIGSAMSCVSVASNTSRTTAKSQP